MVRSMFCFRYFFLSIIPMIKAKINVNTAKNFSKFVFANIFPIVFRMKSMRKHHNTMFIVFFVNIGFTKFAFIDKIKIKNKFIIIEIVSKAYISISVVSLPPQAIL